MNNYTVAPKLYNTGFIPESASALRIKQNLPNQDISNICMLNNNTCNIYNMYPAEQTQLRYNCIQQQNKRACSCAYFDALLHGKTIP